MKSSMTQLLTSDGFSRRRHDRLFQSSGAKRRRRYGSLRDWAARCILTRARWKPDDGQWTRATKDYANTRYSTLDQINAGNVSQLKVAWTFDTGVARGQEAAPIVANNTMYIAAPWPNTLYALDLTKSGALKWKFEPNPSPAAKGEACCDWVNRGAVFSDGKVIYNTLDGYTVAVDANSGKLLWRTHLADIQNGETITMAPMVVHNKVFVGDSGGEFGVRGWLSALDVNSGKLLWQAYNTGPDKDVLIGDKFKPFYASDKGTDLGVKTWPPDAWKVGGGTVWGFLAYDPSTNLIYYGTANPGPWNAEVRPGDNKWTSGMFARDADTGQAAWFYQMSPHDIFDWDGINEDILLDLPWQGATRKVLVRPDRNGYVYVMDRTTGQVLSATPYVYTTTTKGVDLNTGRLITIADKVAKDRRRNEKYLSDGAGLQRLATVFLLPAHRARLHPSRKHVHG